MNFLSNDLLNPYDFIIHDNFFEPGGYGKVFPATRRIDGKKFAMKFFGYTDNKPEMEAIKKEIEIMRDLNGLQGVVQLEGIFMDTAQGLKPQKRQKFKFAYPVIVMGILEGGDLFQRIIRMKTVNEQDLAALFKSCLLSVRDIHSRYFIHRDLKLENLILNSLADDSKMTIIDFGSMVRLPCQGGVYAENKYAGPVGTPGYFSPESLIAKQYSEKSDIWQAGCILYAMLSGQPAYHPGFPVQITSHTYYPLTGPAWVNISEEAKDLVRKMLTKDADERITLDEMFEHPWINFAASENVLSCDYLQRIRALALRQKMKRFFLDHHIELETRVRRDDLKRVITAAVSVSQQSGLADNLRNLEVLVMDKMKALAAANADAHETNACVQTLIQSEDLDIKDFYSVLNAANLPDLAVPEVFNIFDLNRDGSISMKEFLFTLLALRPPENEEEEEEAARLYFNIFDVDGNGFVDKNEMRTVISCLFTDAAHAASSSVKEEHAISVSNIDDLYHVIDINGDGEISFEEFKQFYEAVLSHTSGRSTAPLTRNPSSATDSSETSTCNTSQADVLNMLNMLSDEYDSI